MKFFLMVVMSLTPAFERQQSYVGKAVELNGTLALYAEEHEEFYADGRRIRLNTVFRDQANEVIATRVVDFSQNSFLPDFQLEDKRTGYVEGSEMVNGGVRLFVRRNKRELFEEKIISVEDPTVIDAGFNNFIQARWDSLMTGRKLYVNFGVPSRLDSYGFRVYKEGESTVNGRRSVIVKCDIDNFIIRLFLDPIILTYDAETKRLVTYEGISNISNQKGENYFVKITYQPYGP